MHKVNNQISSDITFVSIKYEALYGIPSGGQAGLQSRLQYILVVSQKQGAEEESESLITDLSPSSTMQGG